MLIKQYSLQFAIELDDRVNTRFLNNRPLTVINDIGKNIVRHKNAIHIKTRLKWQYSLVPLSEIRATYFGKNNDSDSDH